MMAQNAGENKADGHPSPGNEVDPPRSPPPPPPPMWIPHGQTTIFYDYTRGPFLTSCPPPHGDQDSVVYAQPTPQVVIVNRLDQQEMLQSNLFIALVSSIFCCPIGLLAIYKALQAQYQAKRGEHEAARLSSIMAKKIAMFAFAVALLIWSFTMLLNTAYLILVYPPRRNIRIFAERDNNGTG